MIERETRSPEETEELGRRLGAAAAPGVRMALVGELGAGKTRFVKGVARGLGVADEAAVTSPTFVLLNLHPARVPLAHFDLYRLEAPDLAALGFYDVRDEAVVVLEWGDKVDERLLGDHLRVSFEVTGPSSRRLRFEPRGPRSEGVLRAANLSA